MKVQARSCPVCNTILDGATQVEGKEVEPQDGDVSICLYCGTASKFQGDKLCKLSEEELFNLPMDGHTRRILIRAREIWESDLKPKFGKQPNVQTSH